MQRVVIASWIFLAACSSGEGSQPPTIVGSWLYTSSQGTAGLGVSFKSDDTYVLTNLVLTSSNSGEAEIETGTYAVHGSTITTTPKRSSCPGPDPVSTVSYSFSGADLVLTTSTGVVSLQPNDGTSSSSFALAIGCFDGKTGSFTEEPLADVSN